MTAPTKEQISDGVSRWSTRIIVGCAVGTCINFAGLAIVLLLISSQASQGADARERQELVFPVSCKLYFAAFDRGEITAKDLRVFETPKQCPRTRR
jgi:hypothetical protein